MTEKYEITPIAHIESDFDTKFGIPRQSGLVAELTAKIVFEEGFRNDDALRRIEEYSHLWLIWQFSENRRDEWSPTVRPPRFGGNVRVGVFATRSPFRPNNLGLSCVRLVEKRKTMDQGTVLIVSGADLMNGTPIFDIKPYVPYSDRIPEASEGFASRPEAKLQVEYEESVLSLIPEDRRTALIEVLSYDPRPRYQENPERIYGMKFSGYDVRFRVSDEILTIVEVL